MTREHVFPAALDRARGEPGWRAERTDWERTPALQVKDVCASCNNGPLSDLDTYAVELDERIFQHHPCSDEEVNLRINRDRLLRVLLKIGYNDARVTGRQVAPFASAAGIVLGTDKITAGSFSLFAGVLDPASCSEDSPKMLLKVGEISRGHIEMTENVSLAKWVQIGPYLFVVLGWRAGVSRQFRRHLERKIGSENGLTVVGSDARIELGLTRVDYGRWRAQLEREPGPRSETA